MSSNNNINRPIGYFMEGKARFGFIGGIGGPMDTVPKLELFARIQILLKLNEGTAVPALKGLMKNQELKDRWVTMEKRMEKMEGKDKVCLQQWAHHQSWWVLSDVEEELERREEELKRGQLEREKTTEMEGEEAKKSQTEKGRERGKKYKREAEETATGIQQE